MTNRTAFSGIVRRFAIAAAALTAPLALRADNPSDLHLSNLTISSGSASYAAGNSILADNGVTISGSASVTFETCNYIRLDPGFQATAGSATQTFQAVIDPVAVSVAPASTTLRPGESRQFIAGANAPCSTAVTWSPPGVGSITAAGVYTAPSSIATPQTVTLTAVSVADPSKSAPATVTLLPPPPVLGTVTAGSGGQFLVSGSGFGTTQGSGMVWLGSQAASVVSWSNTQIVAQAAADSVSGTAQVLQYGAWSNSAPFTINSLRVDNVNPASGVAGSSVTVTGGGFGALRGSGSLLLGSATGQVVSWSDTQIVAQVASGSVSGVARVRQGGAWSNAVKFEVPAPSGSAAVVVPNVLNLSAGETHSLQALDASGHAVTGLSWTSSDASVATVADGVVTAVAAGHVTVTAGTASADVTVWAGALPEGTVIWSNPGATTWQSSLCVGEWIPRTFPDSLSANPGTGHSEYTQTFWVAILPNTPGYCAFYDQIKIDAYRPTPSLTTDLVETRTVISVNSNTGLTSSGTPIRRCR